MPKTPAWRVGVRRRSYEAHLDWVRYLNCRAARIYKAEHGSWPSQNAPNRKAVRARYEDRRRLKRQRARHQRRIDNLPQAIERERVIAASIADDSRLQAEYVAAVKARRDLNNRRAAAGLNALPNVDKPRLGRALQPTPDGWQGNLGRIRHT